MSATQSSMRSFAGIVMYITRLPSREIAGCRSEEHTSELQSRQYLVCRLLLEKKKEIMGQRITQAQTAGQYFTNDPIKEMTRKVSYAVDLVKPETKNERPSHYRSAAHTQVVTQ